MNLVESEMSRDPTPESVDPFDLGEVFEVTMMTELGLYLDCGTVEPFVRKGTPN